MEKQFTDGWRGRIGLVATAPGNATEADFNKFRPEGVAVMTTRIPLSGSTPEGIAQMNHFSASAAGMLSENAFCDVILLSSTAGSFLDGLEADRENAQALSRKCRTKVITSAGCMLKALKATKARNLTLITPSSAALNDIERRFLENAGYRIAAQGGFHLSTPRDILCVSPEEVLHLIAKTDVPEADTILISCSGLHVMEIIDTLEQTRGKRVLASNQFGLWGALRSIGIPDPVPHAGSLLAGF